MQRTISDYRLEPARRDPFWKSSAQKPSHPLLAESDMRLRSKIFVRFRGCSCGLCGVKTLRIPLSFCNSRTQGNVLSAGAHRAGIFFCAAPCEVFPRSLNKLALSVSELCEPLPVPPQTPDRQGDDFSGRMYPIRRRRMGWCGVGYFALFHRGVRQPHQPVPFSREHHVNGLGISC